MLMRNGVYTDDIGRSFSNRRPEERAGLLRQPRSATSSAEEEQLLELKQDLEEGIASMLQKNSTTLDANLAFHEQELERVERELRELREKKKSKANGKKKNSKTTDSQESKDAGTKLNSSNSSPSQSLWLLGLFLFFAAYVNTNDPDAFFWTPCYGFAGILSWLCLVKPDVVRTTLRNLYKTYFVMSLAVAAGSFSLLRSEASRHNISVSGKSGWLGVFELEPVREGGGALIMAWAMYLCLPHEASSSSSSSSNATLSLIITSASGIVAALAIYLGVILPQYYTRLGVPIPEHCGGSGEEPEVNLLMQS